MASFRTLGQHLPSALPYLISEGIVPDEADPALYTWETYHDTEQGQDALDELLTTDCCVVWSRNGTIRKIFDFRIEEQKILHAVLTYFPHEEKPIQRGSYATKETEDASQQTNKKRKRSMTAPINRLSEGDPSVSARDNRSRALVVFLKSKAHVYFLQGSSHILNLTFEVEKVFPAPRGLIIQRRLPPESKSSSPGLPSAPPNSFFSSFNFSPQSFRASQSFTTRKRQTWGASNASGVLTLSELLQKSRLDTPDDDLPRLYSLTDPLSELGLIVHNASNRPQSSYSSSTYTAVTGSKMEVIPRDEELLYISTTNEVPFTADSETRPLLFAVTANNSSRKYSMWAVSYLRPLPASTSDTLIKNTSLSATSKPRRRSSFMPGTGATTPVGRTRDGQRESFGGAMSKIGTSRSRTAPASFSASQQSRDAGVEDVLASQLDPDNEVSGIPDAVKESRRVSSLLSRGDLSTSFDKNAFQEMATQRTSLGASFNSQSRMTHGFGLHGGRPSWSASQNSQTGLRPNLQGDRISLGADNVDETIEDQLTPGGHDLIGDASELELAADLGSLGVQEPISGLKREIIMSKFGEIPMPGTPYTQGDSSDRNPRVRVFTSCSLQSMGNNEDVPFRTFVHLVDYSSRTYIKVEYGINRVSVDSIGRFMRYSQQSHTPTLLIPNVKDVSYISNCLDVVKVTDGADSCLMTLDRDINEAHQVTLHACIPIPCPLGRLCWDNPYVLSKTFYPDREPAGLSQMIDPPQAVVGLAHCGPGGTLDLMDKYGTYHRLQIQLRPKNQLIGKALDIFKVVLPKEAGDLITMIWWEESRNMSNNNNNAAIEWDAFVVAIFSFVMCFLPENSRQAGDRSEITKRQQRKSDDTPLFTSKVAVLKESMWNEQVTVPGRKSWSGNAWKWVADKIMEDANTSWRQLKNYIPRCVERTRRFLTSKKAEKVLARLVEGDGKLVRETLPLLVYVLHIIREEYKLSTASPETAGTAIGDLSLIIAQLGGWLGWDSWSWKKASWYMLDGNQMDLWAWDDTVVKQISRSEPPFERPPGVFEWLESACTADAFIQFPTLKVFLQQGQFSVAPVSSTHLDRVIHAATPRLEAITRYLENIHSGQLTPARNIELMKECGIGKVMLETFPEAVSAILQELIARCQASPPTTWDSSLLQLVGRGDLDLVSRSSDTRAYDVSLNQQLLTVPRDVHHICESVERPEPMTNAALADGSMITRLIFSQDQRFLEAAKLVEPLRTQIAECPPDPSWSDTEVLEAQKTIVQYVMTRTFAIAPAQAMVHFDTRRPLPTEKFTVHGYTTMCVMKPMNITVTANREGYTEERYAWAWFHAGVSAGLSISKRAEGIDTSWIVFNKPTELTNRHAGLLLGLGLNGHLKSLAKWLSFKYLTPKHTMTSVGLLLGLSAAFLGTMDALVTRLLSVHVTRMLPPGAAELNLNPLTQTTGVMGIGLLYYNTQHRRMSEVLISEIEHAGTEELSTGSDTLRDEGYRLAAGFSLGFINLAKGAELKGLHDMRVVERLLATAVGPRPIDLVHILDQATAGAIIAIALIFMKTENDAVAKKVNVPDTLPQFDFVRPDVLLLRTLARHLIMWNGICPDYNWIVQNLPREYAGDYMLKEIKSLKSEHMPFFNIIAGLLWSVSLKYAGSGNTRVRDFLIHYLDQLIRLCNLPALRYDAKLARNTVRNCQDLLALSAATVMAGTGDLHVFRRLRLLHGRINADTPYGSHLAAHLAIGVLFLAGGRYTFSTSPLAIASLICAFYPLFPQDVLDNKAHLQAFRHLWVLAAEPRCLIVRDVDTHRAIPMPVSIHLKDGTEQKASAPCLLPELQEVASVRTTSPEYWSVVLDFQQNLSHLSAFRDTQTLHARRRPASEVHGSIFSATLIALNDAQNVLTARLMFNWIFNLPLFKAGQLIENAEWALVLPADTHSSVYMDGRGTVVDHKLGLVLAAKGDDADRLWNLRCIFRWAEEAVGTEGRLRWLGWEVVEELRARIMKRADMHV